MKCEAAYLSVSTSTEKLTERYVRLGDDFHPILQRVLKVVIVLSSGF
jgi:hypothetical protein